jgi:PPOX class probable F420-dependent enzyme
MHRAHDSRPPVRSSERSTIEASRRAALATIAGDGSARLVPVCFAVLEGGDGLRFVTPLDEKPKRSGDPRELARVRDILARPEVALLFDRWDEDWSRLAWVRIHGRARLVEPSDGEHAPALAALRARYPQYVAQDLERLPVILIEPTRVVSWTGG